MCIVEAGRPIPVALDHISGRSLHIHSNSPLMIGEKVTLNHPVAGAISGEIAARGNCGVEVRLAGDESAIAFALSAIAADMTCDD